MKKQTGIHSASPNRTGRTGRHMPAVVFATVMMSICFAGLLICAALVCQLLHDPLRYAPYFAPAVMIVSGYVGGAVYAARRGEGGLVCGVVMGGILAGMLLVFSLLFGGGDGINTGMRVLMAGAAVLASVTGGYLASHKKKKTVGPEKQLKKLRAR